MPKKEGFKGTKVYKAWENMKSRCYNKNRPDYKYYGGKGVTVCERWLKASNFCQDIGEIPKELELDRINNDGNYEPGNIRLVTKRINCANRSKKNKLGIRGVSKLPGGNYRAQIKGSGWSISIGTFKCPLSASAAFQLKHKELYGF